MTTPVFFHVALPDDWDRALADGEYRMSTRGATVDEVGFVHGAFAEQVGGVVQRFYADLDRVVLLTIDPATLDVPVVIEPPADGIPEHFPHVYGPVPLHAVTRAVHVAVTDLLGEVERPTRDDGVEGVDGDDQADRDGPDPDPGRPTIAP